MEQAPWQSGGGVDPARRTRSRRPASSMAPMEPPGRRPRWMRRRPRGLRRGLHGLRGRRRRTRHRLEPWSRRRIPSGRRARWMRRRREQLRRGRTGSGRLPLRMRGVASVRRHPPIPAIMAASAPQTPVDVGEPPWSSGRSRCAPLWLASKAAVTAVSEQIRPAAAPTTAGPRAPTSPPLLHEQ